MQDSVYCETKKRDRETVLVPDCFQGAVVYHHWVLRARPLIRQARRGGVCGSATNEPIRGWDQILGHWVSLVLRHSWEGGVQGGPVCRMFYT